MTRQAGDAFCGIKIFLAGSIERWSTGGVIGGDDDEGVFVFFGKIDGNFDRVFKGYLIENVSREVVCVSGMVNFSTFYL